MIYLQLFLSYFKIGLFGFGGGYAMLSLIQHEVVERQQWLSDAEFTNIVAISQMTPGPVGINSATYIGYTVSGTVVGAIVATFALCLPSLILVLLLAHTYQRFRTNRYVANAFQGIRLVVVGLIAAATLQLVTPATFIDYSSILFFAVAFLLLLFNKMHPVALLLLSGAVGLVV